MRTLITGGAGFLGAALANRLAGEGHAVYVLDDLTAGDRDRLDPRVVFTRGDVRDVPRLWSLLAGVNVVYHLAARVSVPESILYPVDYNAVNTGGTVSLMSAARDAGVRRVVFTSSGTIYGEQERQPIAESAEPRPANPYAVSKLAAEHYVRAIGDLYRIETVILRVFNAYGPGQAVPPAHPPVIPHFVRQIAAGGSIVLHGSPPAARRATSSTSTTSSKRCAAPARRAASPAPRSTSEAGSRRRWPISSPPSNGPRAARLRCWRRQSKAGASPACARIFTRPARRWTGRRR